MKSFFDKLDGYKTFIGGAIVFIAGGLLAIKVIDQQTFEALAAIGGAISVVGLRFALKKLS